MMKLYKLFVVLAIVLSTSYSAFSQHVTIERKVAANGCIMGYLLVDNEVICYTLELPYIGNIPNISTIPTGTYSARIRVDGSKGWRIELKDVPDRENVQIHVGNYTNQIQGCTLIGTGAKVENCTVLNSQAARTKVQQAFLKYLDREIKVTYRQ